MTNAPVHEAPLTYEEAKELARHQDVTIRKSLAEREDIRPEILYYLAGDPDVEVRKAIANNRTTPARAYVELAKDQSDDIRSVLASKIAGLAPKLTAYEVDRVQSYVFQALELLAADQLCQVRIILADILKEVTQAPEEVVKKLAQDVELSVSGPILEHSPILSDADLLEIVSGGISSGALGAISKRVAVSSSVSDAIINTNDVPAITSLLCNTSAQIREEALDNLIEKSKDVTEWQGPIVNRPVLSDSAAQRLAEFVAGNLLEALQNRDDLSPETLQMVKNKVSARIEKNRSTEPLVIEALNDNESNSRLKSEYAWLFQQSPQEIASNLHRMNRLTPQVVANALNDGDYEFVIAGLAQLSGFDISIAQRIFAMRSARAIVSLCWKSGVDAFTAVRIQAKVASIPANDLVKGKNNAYPLKDEEMEWQLDFFRNMAV